MLVERGSHLFGNEQCTIDTGACKSIGTVIERNTVVVNLQ